MAIISTDVRHALRNGNGSGSVDDSRHTGQQGYDVEYYTRRTYTKPQSRAHSPSSSSSNSSSNSKHKRVSSGKGDFQHSHKKPDLPVRSQYVALDCEMVVSVTGNSMCARVVLVNWKGKIIYDTYVQPTEDVADYKTFVSGITATNLEGAPTLESVRERVKEFLNGKILVGHGLENDLASLYIDHPWRMTRDTAYYQPFMQLLYTRTGEAFYAPRKLRDLCSTKLQREIQQLGQAHCPAEDAIAALDLYKSHRPRWEAVSRYRCARKSVLTSD